MSIGGRNRANAAGRLSVLVGVLSVPTFVGVWELIARLRIVNAVLFPPPSTVAVAVLDWIHSGQFSATFQRASSASVWDF